MKPALNQAKFDDAMRDTIVSLVGTDYLLRIHGDGDLLVEVDRDGGLTYGEAYDPDEAAHRFWRTLAATVPAVRAALVEGGGR